MGSDSNTAEIFFEAPIQKIGLSMTLVEQIKLVMDGRSARMVALEVRIPEMEFYRKMNGKAKFKKEEIDRINQRFKGNIIFEE